MLIAKRPRLRLEQEEDEIEPETEGVVTHLADEDEQEDPATRGKWLKQLQEIPLSEFTKSSRLQALLKAWSDT